MTTGGPCSLACTTKSSSPSFRRTGKCDTRYGTTSRVQQASTYLRKPLDSFVGGHCFVSWVALQGGPTGADHLALAIVLGHPHLVGTFVLVNHSRAEGFRRNWTDTVPRSGMV